MGLSVWTVFKWEHLRKISIARKFLKVSSNHQIFSKVYLSDLTNALRPPLPEEDSGPTLDKLRVLDELKHDRCLWVGCDEATTKNILRINLITAF